MNKKSETALEYFFYGEEFELWKLQSTEQYIYFFGMIVIGIVGYVLLKRYLKTQRTQEKGVARVCKRLDRLAKKPHCLIKNVALKLPECSAAIDGILLDKSGIYLVKVFGWGLEVYGTPDGETWRLKDRVREERVANPLPELKKAASAIQSYLEEKGIKRIKIQPLVVFADSYSVPELYLGYGSNATTYQALKEWYQKQASVKDAQYDFERVSTIIKSDVI